MAFQFGPRRGRYVEVADATHGQAPALPPQELEHFEAFDLIYRSLCALLYNYVPLSGHPGGSISSGRFVAGILFDAMDYDVSQPGPRRRRPHLLRRRAQGARPVRHVGAAQRGAAHRRARAAAARRAAPAAARGPARLPPQPVQPHAAVPEVQGQGARRPSHAGARPSSGSRPAPRAWAWRPRWAWPSAPRDYYGADAPARAHRRGRGRPDPRPRRRGAGRAPAPPRSATPCSTWTGTRPRSTRTGSAATARSPATTCSGRRRSWPTCTTGTWCSCPTARTSSRCSPPSAWRPALDNGQPTAIVYRTVKGWQYGIEGRASHGAGHALCSDGFYQRGAAAARRRRSGPCPAARASPSRAAPERTAPAVVEACFWDALQVVRRAVEERPAMVAAPRRPAARRARAAGRPGRARPARARPASRRCTSASRRTAAGSPRRCGSRPARSPRCATSWGARSTTYNQASGGALFVTAADLLGSTSVNQVAEGFPAGYWNAATNPRLAHARDRRHLRGRHERRRLGPRRLRAAHRRGLVVRRLHRAARAHRRAPARHRQPGAAGRGRRALPAAHPGLRARRA